MSAARLCAYFCGLSVFTLVVIVLPWASSADQNRAEEPASRAATNAADPAADLAKWKGESAVTVDQLKHHAVEIGQLLQRASDRVDGLAEDAAGHAESRALLGAIRHELELSRRWNRHLTSILLEVADERRALREREQKAAAEIFELTSIAEEARLELIALWKSLRPGMSLPFGEQDVHQTPRPATSEESVPSFGGRAAAVSPEAPDETVSDARRVIDEIDAMQENAAGDIEAVRAKIMDALHTLAPHRKDPVEKSPSEGRHIEGKLSSKEITAWAAAIASKLHHEGFNEDTYPEIGNGSSLGAAPGVEEMLLQSEIVTTAAVRAAPDRRAYAIATVQAGSRILVTGKVIDQDWYRVEIGDGRLGYISSDLIRHQAVPTKTDRRIKAS